MQVLNCELAVLSLLVATVLVRGQHAEVECTSARPEGSCQPMSPEKALLDPEMQDYALHSVIVTSSHIANRLFECTPTVNQSVIRDLSVSVFPADSRKFLSMLIHWRTGRVDDVNGYEVQVRTPDDVALFYASIDGSNTNSVLLQKVYRHYKVSDNNMIVRVKAVRVDHTCIDFVTSEVPVAGECEGVIYNQQCSPDGIRHSMITSSEVNVQTYYTLDQTSHMSVQLTWPASVGLHVVVALNEEGQRLTNCTKAGRNPPCFIAANTTNITVGPLNVETHYTAYVHAFDPSPCPNHGLANLLNGCGGPCCSSFSIFIPHPSITFEPVTRSLPLSLVHPTSTLATVHPSLEYPSVNSDVITPSQESPTPFLTLSLATQTPASVSKATLQPNDPNGLTSLAIALPAVVVFIVALIILLSGLLLLRRKHNKHKHSLDHVIKASSHVIKTTSHWSNSTLPDLETSNALQSLSKPSVLVLYSPRTPPAEREEILTLLVCGLSQYSIDAKSPDTCVNNGISCWLEKEVKDSTVLCVCNQAMKEDWEDEKPSQLVSSLRLLVYGGLIDGLSNFATVSLQEKGDYVPSQYLKAQAQFVVGGPDDISNIAHHILGIPLYATTQ